MKKIYRQGWNASEVEGRVLVRFDNGAYAVISQREETFDIQIMKNSFFQSYKQFSKERVIAVLEGLL